MLANNAPTRLLIDGEEYLIHPLTLGELEGFQTWIDSLHRDPIAAVLPHLNKGLTMAQEQFLLGRAVEVASRPGIRLGSKEATPLLESSEGTKEYIFRGIAKGRPGFTRADMEALWLKLTPAHLEAAKLATGIDALLTDPN